MYQHLAITAAVALLQRLLWWEAHALVMHFLWTARASAVHMDSMSLVCPAALIELHAALGQHVEKNAAQLHAKQQCCEQPSN